MDGDDSKGNGETKQLKLTNNKTVSTQSLHFDKFDEEDNGTSLHKSFREKSLISGFIVDRPPAKNSISYRLLHRLDLNFFDSSDGEEGYLYSDLKETKKSKQNDISQILCNYSLRDTINVLTLFLESRFAIPIYSAEIMELLKITRRIEKTCS
ncbi:hypothetical protein QYM36_017679 [Artemia franciscana]|uniref:Uncharacterized protein n=1 Tax=Artemia franciscana TaxID=6661 RepID=A0AA88HEJ8_ARTSF|nr:hypothetical protein QYM36_017679 [Artemia franciscana]